MWRKSHYGFLNYAVTTQMAKRDQSLRGKKWHVLKLRREGLPLLRYLVEQTSRLGPLTETSMAVCVSGGNDQPGEGEVVGGVRAPTLIGEADRLSRTEFVP